MHAVRLTSVAIICVYGLGGPALAQQAPSVVGTWSSQQQGEGGMVEATIGMGTDGTYAIETQYPNGTRMRVWGTYVAAQVSQSEIQIVPQVSDWKPHQICTQAPGFAPSCTAFQPLTPQTQTLTFTSPDAYESGGGVWSRDADAMLLQQPVADPLVQYAQAPVQPQIPQPVAPLSPSGSSLPADPRAQYEKGNDQFLNGYMRGCTMINGQWQDCSQ
jgi:hypothetical protein